MILIGRRLVLNDLKLFLDEILCEVLKVYYFRRVCFYGLVAQLVRAPPCHGGGRGFESLPGRFTNIFWDLSSAGRASALQAEGHRFEPCRSHSEILVYMPTWLNWQSS